MADSALLLYLTTIIQITLSENPWCCHGLDCPTFGTLKNITSDGQTVEIRNYSAKLWVSTQFEGGTLSECNISPRSKKLHSFDISFVIYRFQTALDGGFQRLFAYINGSNEAQEKIAMTTPVLNIVSEGRVLDTYEVSFFVPYKYQPPKTPPPKPSDSKVYINAQPQITVGVISFSGFENDREDEKEAERLEKVLKENGIEYLEGKWAFAGYDPPFRLTGRHNEVWHKVTKL